MGQFKFYLLVPRHTPAYSLIANAMLMCRFAPPLAFNFMAALAMPPSDQHTFKARPGSGTFCRRPVPVCAPCDVRTAFATYSMPGRCHLAHDMLPWRTPEK